jgi:hypothetical protein
MDMARKTSKPALTIELTPEQREEIKKTTGKEVAAVRLKPEELEERIAPGLGSVN